MGTINEHSGKGPEVFFFSGLGRRQVRERQKTTSSHALDRQRMERQEGEGEARETLRLLHKASYLVGIGF